MYAFELEKQINGGITSRWLQAYQQIVKQTNQANCIHTYSVGRRMQ